jgi:hypothetical protein
MKRTILSIAVALILVLGLLPNAILADTSGSSSGSFSVNITAPTVNSVRLYESNGTTLATSMTPQTPYIFKVDVTDMNGLDYLTAVRVIVFYSETTPVWPSAPILLTSAATTGDTTIHVASASGFAIGNNILIKDTASSEYAIIDGISGTTLTLHAALAHSYSTADFFRATVTNFNILPVTPNSQILAQFNWIASTNSWNHSYPAPTGDSGASTWSSRSFSTPTSGQLSADNNFVFQGEFTPGKVSTAGNWYIRVRVSDLQNYDGRGTAGPFIMNPYNEIVLSTQQLNWGAVNIDPVNGFAFTDSPNPQQVTVKYISNDNYTKYIQSSDWSGVSHTALLDNDGSATLKNHFALKAAMGSNTDLVTDLTPYGALVDNTDGLTLEMGELYSPTSEETATMSLKLAKTFDSDVYLGYIYYYIITD